MERVIIFTTRDFMESRGEGKNTSLFGFMENSISNGHPFTIDAKGVNCKLYKIRNNLTDFHIKYSKFKIAINNQIKKELKNEEDLGKKKQEIEKYFKSTKATEDPFKKYNTIIQKSVSNEKINRELNGFIENELFRFLTKLKNLGVNIEYFHQKIDKPAPKYLYLRKYIFRRKYTKKGGENTKKENSNIFGYRCLDLYNDYVRDYNGFITAVIRDVASILGFQELEGFFVENELTLVLHGEDINFKKGTIEQDINNIKVFECNTDLDGFASKISTYIYQHKDYNLFTDLLSNYNNESVEELNQKIENFFTNRINFEKKEKNLFDDSSISSMRKNLNSNFKKALKIY